MAKAKFRKTAYCWYHCVCDKERGCFDGDLCQYFEWNPSIPRPDNDFFEIYMDTLWQGKGDGSK